MKFGLKKPCPKCPFRSDIDGYLTPERAEEIVESLMGGGTFSCHQTNEFTEDDDGEPRTVETDRTQHCAGALIFLEKQEAPNQMMRIAERLGAYDRTKLDMDAPVFDDEYEFIDAQERQP